MTTTTMRIEACWTGLAAAHLQFWQIDLHIYSQIGVKKLQSAQFRKCLLMSIFVYLNDERSRDKLQKYL